MAPLQVLSNFFTRVLGLYKVTYAVSTYDAKIVTLPYQASSVPLLLSSPENTFVGSC